MQHISRKAFYCAAATAAVAAGFAATVPAQAATTAPAARTVSAVPAARELPAAAATWPVVAQGATGERVVGIQYLLNQRIGAGLAVDGQFGPLTTAAVKKFQVKFGLPANGQVASTTWTRLIVQVQRGNSGPAVAAVQHSLRYAYGYSSLAVDGIFGPATQAAVRGFQAKFKIGVDGIVGAVTWNTLIVHEG